MPSNRRIGGENKYEKRERMLSEDDLVLDSTICLDVNIQLENI